MAFSTSNKNRSFMPKRVLGIFHLIKLFNFSKTTNLMTHINIWTPVSEGRFTNLGLSDHPLVCPSVTNSPKN